MGSKKCSVCESENSVCKFEEILYCSKHYYQMREYGKILERTKQDKNKVEINENVVKMYLYDSKNNVVGYTMFDLDDLEVIGKYKWGTNARSKYVMHNGSSGTHFFMHHFIMNFNKKENPDLCVDHINRDRRDNRKCNLRIVSMKENAINKGKQSNNTSGFPGVSWDNYHHKWESSIKIDGKKKFLAYSNDINDAIEIRKNAEIKYFGAEVDRSLDNNTVYKRKGQKVTYNDDQKENK